LNDDAIKKAKLRRSIFGLAVGQQIRGRGAKMANKSMLRVQVSLRRVVNFNQDQSGEAEEAQANEKASVQGAKVSKVQDVR
jgi:hypothetical protein